MAKPKDPKPATPLFDPKGWEKCKHKGCDSYAIFLEDYCWEHLPDRPRSMYKAKIEEWVKDGAALLGANLQGVNLSDANFKGAFILGTNLQEASLSGSNLQGANLAHTTLFGVFLSGVRLEGVQQLTWEQIKVLGEEREKMWWDAQYLYRRLKNLFHQQGQYEDEAKAYYREKLMAKHQAHEELFGRRWRVLFKTAKKSWLRLYARFIKGIKRAFQNIGKFFVHNKNKGMRRRWFGLWFMWALAGFGERWIRTIAWAVGTFVFFGLLHWLGTNVGGWSLLSRGGEIKNLLDCLYFSLVTFVTLGFGDIWPEAWVAKIIVGVEVVFGYVFLGLIVTLIARKMGR